MLPCKKRRTTLRESAQHQGNQEEDDVDLQADGKPESDLGSVKDLGSVSLSWSPSRGRAADLEVQAAGIQLGMEDPSLSSRMLTEHTNVAVLEAVDVAVSQEITLASLESSQPVNTHIGKGKLQATSSRRGKKITLRPESVTQEDRGDHPIAKEPFSEEPSEEVKEGGKIRKIFRLYFLCQYQLVIAFVLVIALSAVPLQNSISERGGWLGLELELWCF